MPSDIIDELQDTFHEAVMQHAAQTLSKSEDWEEARGIIECGEAQRAELRNAYARDYDARVETVRQRLFDEAAQTTLDHPVPLGQDRTNSEIINEKAHREVQQGHERDLQRSREEQTQEMLDLQDTARARDNSRGKARDDFAVASDRRQGLDRRNPTRTR